MQLDNTSFSSVNGDQPTRLPIIIEIDRCEDFITSERRIFVNFDKSDWYKFEKEEEPEESDDYMGFGLFD